MPDACLPRRSYICSEGGTPIFYFTNFIKAAAADGDAGPFFYDFFIICSEIRSASAPMVIAGFGPIAVGTMAPSATYKSG